MVRNSDFRGSRRSLAGPVNERSGPCGSPEDRYVAHSAGSVMLASMAAAPVTWPLGAPTANVILNLRHVETCSVGGNESSDVTGAFLK